MKLKATKVIQEEKKRYFRRFKLPDLQLIKID
jgi:hypothetical protein